LAVNVTADELTSSLWWIKASFCSLWLTARIWNPHSAWYCGNQRLFPRG